MDIGIKQMQFVGKVKKTFNNFIKLQQLYKIITGRGGEQWQWQMLSVEKDKFLATGFHLTDVFTKKNPQQHVSNELLKTPRHNIEL